MTQSYSPPYRPNMYSYETYLASSIPVLSFPSDQTLSINETCGSSIILQVGSNETKAPAPQEYLLIFTLPPDDIYD